MPGFTSTVMSTADLGQWDYYIFSDNVAIWRALNGLAAWFNGSGGLLQNAAWLGALIVLAMILYGAAVGKSVANSGTLGIWFFFMSTMGLTGQANVYNMYTNQVTVVSNVPALALIPASAFSKAGYSVFTSMETAFQGVSGSYMSVSQNGFVGPLEILLSLRSNKIANINPALDQTLAQVVHDCSIDPAAAGGAPPMEKSLDALNWLTIYGRKNGLTRIFKPDDPTKAGEIVSCEMGLQYVNNAYGSLAAGSADLTALLNQETTRRNPQDVNGLWNAASLNNSYNMLVATATGVTQSAIEFTKNALVASTVTMTMECMSQSGLLNDADVCQTGSFALGDSMEKWKTSAAMSASGFLKTMFTSMGILQALFFSLFPIIAIYGLVVPIKTAKVFGGFIFFGIWCQSWLLAVSPIQSYIQTSIIEEVGKITAGFGGMTLGNTMAVYQLLSTKLAVASDIMASAQMLSLALLSGSMVALSGLAGKWSAEKHMDTSKLQVDGLKNGPLVESKAVNSTSTIVTPQGKAVGINTKVGDGAPSITSNFTKGSNEVAGRESAGAHERGRNQETAFAATLMKQHGLTREQAASAASTTTALNTYQGTVGTEVAGALGGMLTKLLGNKAGSVPASKQAEMVSQAQTKAIQQLAAKDAGFIGKLMGKAGKEAQVDAAADLVEYGGNALTGIALGAEILTGVGAVATPATAIAGTVATQAAKKALTSTLRSKLKDSVKDGAKDAALAAGTQAVENLAQRGPGGVELAAKALAGGLGATYSAAIQGAKKSETSAAVKKTDTDTDTISGSETDKLTEAWKKSETQKHGISHSGGQSQVVSVSLDRANIMRMYHEGFNGTTPDELAASVRGNEALLRSISSPKDVAAADAFVAQQMLGRTARDYGRGGVEGQKMLDFERGLYFQHAVRGQISGSMLNTPRGNPVAPTIETEQDKNGKTVRAPEPQQVVPKPDKQVAGGGLGEKVGEGKVFTKQAPKVLAKGQARQAATSRREGNPQDSLARGVGAEEVAAHNEAVEENKVKIAAMAAAGAGGAIVSKGLEGKRNRESNSSPQSTDQKKEGKGKEQQGKTSSPSNTPSGGQENQGREGKKRFRPLAPTRRRPN